MNKMNNKGFLLAESLIVTTFVLTVLIYLFAQFKNLMIEYKKTYQYNTVEDIYNLGSISKFLTQNNITINSNQYIFKDNDCTNEIPIEKKKTFKEIVKSMKIDYLIFADSNIDNVKNNMSSYNQDMQDFVERVSTKKIDGKGRLLAKFKKENYVTFATILVEKNASSIIKSWTRSASTDFHNSTYRTNITSVIFEDNINIPEGATSWDVSAVENSGAVMAWVTADHTDSTKYVLHIGAEGGVIANPNSDYLFYNFSALKSINFNNNYDTSNAISMSYMFHGCQSLTSLDLGEKFDTSNVTSMYQMFRDCSALTSLDLRDKFNTSNVQNTGSMFSGCKALTSLDLGDKFDTKSVTNMSLMFNDCKSLTTLDLGAKFDTSSVTNMSEMFDTCLVLTNLDLGDKFNTSSVTNMSGMFDNCKSLINLNLGDKFDTSSVQNMYRMFLGCQSLTSLDLGNKFDTSNVTDMSYIFNACHALTKIYAPESFVTTNVTSSRDMFTGDDNLVGGNGTSVATKKIYDKTYAKIDKPGQEGYFTTR